MHVDDVLNAAEKETGLGDWGDDLSFRVGLDVLLDAVEASDAPPHIRDAVRAQILGLLATRLRLVEDERRHPEVLDIGIERPVVLIGLARSGTTILHDLMALAPDARAPLEWETHTPWPSLDAPGDDAERVAAVQAGLDGLLAAAPELRSMHPWGATLPSDCLNFAALHFASAAFWAGYAIPAFATWLATSPVEGLYRTHRRALQQLQWGKPVARWTLKEPTHQLNLAQLMETYPDACLVQTHRDPVRTLPSVADLVYTIQKVSRTDTDPHETGRSALELFGACLERSTAARRDAELEAMVLDIAYRDTVTDPVGTVRRIHEHFDLPFSDEHAKRIDEHMRENAQHKHGRHEYRAEDYGMDVATIATSFPEYRERFGHLLAEPAKKAG